MKGLEILLRGNQVKAFLSIFSQSFSLERSGNLQYGRKEEVDFISQCKYMVLSSSSDFIISLKEKKNNRRQTKKVCRTVMCC